MILRFLKKCGAVSIIFLVGCGADKENNFDKIMRFEIENAKSILDDSILQAEQLAQAQTSDVHLDDFRNYPIYENYKKTHADLGLDVNQIHYVKNANIQHLDSVKKYEAEQRAALPEQPDHIHTH